VSRCGPAAVVGRGCWVFRRGKLIIIYLEGAWAVGWERSRQLQCRSRLFLYANWQSVRPNLVPCFTWYYSPARPFAAPDAPLLVTGQQGGPSPACRQLSRARNACAGSSSQESTKLGHGTKLGRTLCCVFLSAISALSKPLNIGLGDMQPSFVTETKKQSPETGARANNTLHK